MKFRICSRLILVTFSTNLSFGQKKCLEGDHYLAGAILQKINNKNL